MGARSSGCSVPQMKLSGCRDEHSELAASCARTDQAVTPTAKPDKAPTARSRRRQRNRRQPSDRAIIPAKSQLDLHAGGIAKIDLHFSCHGDVADRVSNPPVLEALAQLTHPFARKCDMVHSWGIAIART